MWVSNGMKIFRESQGRTTKMFHCEGSEAGNVALADFGFTPDLFRSMDDGKGAAKNFYCIHL